MGALSFNVLLFGGKWVLIALIYSVLIVVLFTVRRELVRHTFSQARPVAAVAGRLKVLAAGSDARLAVGKILLLQPATNLGSEADNDLVLSDQYVSRHHARLRWDGAVWWIEDLGSMNGTSVDGQACPPRTPRALHQGATLKLGDMLFELVA